MKTYLAGKITENGWRHTIFSELRNSDEQSALSFGRFEYTGPYFISDDHGMMHGKNTHGRGVGKKSNELMLTDLRIEGRNQVVSKCLRWIEKSDFVFVWIDNPEAYGTFVELGYVIAKKKPLFIGIDNNLKGSNFIKSINSILQATSEIHYANTALESWNCLIDNKTTQELEENINNQSDVVKGFKRTLNANDAVLWLEKNKDIYNILMKIGYVKGLNKPIFLGMDEKLEKHPLKDDIWFALQMCDSVEFGSNKKEASDILLGFKPKKPEKTTKKQLEFARSMAVKVNKKLVNITEDSSRDLVGKIISYFKDNKYEIDALEYIEDMTITEIEYTDGMDYKYSATKVVEILKKKLDGLPIKMHVKTHADLVKKYNAKGNSDFTMVFEGNWGESLLYNENWITFVYEKLAKNELKEEKKDEVLEEKEKVKETTNSIGIKVLEPIVDIVEFKTKFDEQKFIEQYELDQYVPKKEKGKWYYKTSEIPTGKIECELKGYILNENGFKTLVVEFEDKSTTCILHLHLREMQKNDFKMNEKIS